MAQPFLNFFHTDAIGKKQSGTTVTKIMIADMPHTVFFQDQGKVLSDIVRLDSIPHSIHIDIVQIVRAV